jgi:fructose/tagatose bisphosphate aldolase
MQTLRNVPEQSEKDRVAIGHFNVADWVLLKAVVAAARDLKVPVVVGASEGLSRTVSQMTDYRVMALITDECFPSRTIRQAPQ